MSNTPKKAPGEKKQKSCFVISPIGKSGSDVRKRADQVLKHIITPPIAARGYQVVRADTIDDPGMITSQIIERIISDDIVVADLSGHNPNVFYELAVRHGVGKPVIHIHDENEAIPFDVAGARSIPFDYRDLDSAARAREDIEKQLESIENSTAAQSNPLSFSFDMRAMESGGDKEEIYLSKVLQILDSQTRQLSMLEMRIKDHEEFRYLVDENIKLKDRLGGLDRSARSNAALGAIPKVGNALSHYEKYRNKS